MVTQPASGVSETGLTLHGSVDPEGEEVEECYFEYGVEAGVYTNRVPCSPPAPLTGSSSLSVSAQLSGLSPSRVRSFRLVAVNANGTARGNGITISAASLTGDAVVEVGAIDATATAQINPGGLSTCYHVEYGQTAAYGTSTPETCTGASGEQTEIRVELDGLQADTSYRFRIVAANALGTTDGVNVAFATFPVPIAGLPDGRAYEPVSPAGTTQDANIYIPYSYDEFSPYYERGIVANPSDQFQVAADGEAVVYSGDPPPNGGTGCSGNCGGNQYMTTHSAQGGWTQTVLESIEIRQEIKNGGIYTAFSSNLSLGIVDNEGYIPGTDAPADYPNYYIHSTTGGVSGEYRPLSSVIPDRAVGELKSIVGGKQIREVTYAGANAGTSTVPEFSHVLFESDAGMLEGEGKLETGSRRRRQTGNGGGKGQRTGRIICMIMLVGGVSCGCVAGWRRCAGRRVRLQQKP